MKIVYCIAGTYNSGGMERVLANKANYWVSRGHEVTIITTDQRGRSSFFHLDGRIEHYDLNINYEENNGKSFLNKLCFYPFKQLKHRLRLSSLLKQLRADIVVSMFCNEVSFVADIHDGSKKVLEVHFSRFKRLQYGRKGLWRLADAWRSWTDERVVKKFHRFVVLTHEDMGYWLGLRNIMVIPNSITALPAQPTSLVNKKALAVGRYTPQKGFDYLIDIWVIVHLLQPHWELYIVGEGECKEALQKQICNNNLEGVVHLVPSTSCIEEMYSEASVLLMTSRYEGLPMVLLEGLAFGLPIISFACKCGPSDIITDGVNGFLISPGNIKEFSEKLLLLMGDVALRRQMGEAAREKSLGYMEEEVMHIWEELFKQLCAGCRWKQL